MNRILVGLSALLLAGFVVTAARPAEPESPQDNAPAAQEEAGRAPEPAREGGYFERGGKDIGRGYGHAGKEFGRGTAGFGKELIQGDFADAGRSMGRGGAEFGKGVGLGTARGFKNFATAFRNWGKKLDSSTRDQDQPKAEAESD